MTVRRATPEDFDAVAKLWREFDHEIPQPTHEGPADPEKELAEMAEILENEIAFVALGDDGAPVGFALARERAPGFGTLTDLFVGREDRRSGVGTELMREVLAAFRERGVEQLDLEVVAANAGARSLYARWGLRDEVVVMTGSIADLEARLGSQEASSFGSIHLQSDNVSAVEHAVRQFVPRLPGGSRGSLVAPPRNGWIAVYDDVCDRNPDMLRRLARELSDRIGAVTLLLGVERDELLRMILFERGRIVDEYLSVPEFYGPLPPGDVVGLAANPRVVLTAHGSRSRSRAPNRDHRLRACRPGARPRPARRARRRARHHRRGARLRRCGGHRRRDPNRAPMKVMLLHAWPPDETMWERQITALERSGFKVLAPRLYGRGASIDGWAARLLEELDGPFVAVGASMGGYCALALARRAPERVVGMVLAGSKATADEMDRRVFRNELIARLREKGVPEDLDTQVEARDLAVAQEAMRDRLDLSGVAASFGGPLLVCVGDGDEIVSVDESRALADSALRGSLEVFEGTGHLLTIEQPLRFNDLLLEFLAQWKEPS